MMKYRQKYINVNGKNFDDMNELNNHLGDFFGLTLFRSCEVRLKFSPYWMTMKRFVNTNLPRKQKNRNHLDRHEHIRRSIKLPIYRKYFDTPR